MVGDSSNDVKVVWVVGWVSVVLIYGYNYGELVFLFGFDWLMDDF